jgi:hypothetical protein
MNFGTNMIQRVPDDVFAYPKLKTTGPAYATFGGGGGECDDTAEISLPDEPVGQRRVPKPAEVYSRSLVD